MNTLHEMGGETSNLVAQTLGCNNGNLIGNLLVGLEVEGETGVVLFNNDTSSLLDGFSSDTTLIIICFFEKIFMTKYILFQHIWIVML